MKLFQLVLFCACQTTSVLAFSTQSGSGGLRSSVRAKLVPYPPKAHYHTKTYKHHHHGVALRMAGIPADDAASTSTNEKPSVVQDALAGLTVAFSLLSKAIACSAIVGVNPLVGLWSSVVMGITAPLSE